MYKIIGADQKEYGPIAADQMRQWIAQGRVNARTQAQDESGQWKALSEFPEFAAAFGISPVSAPPVMSNLPPPPAGPAKTSGMAVASLVLGIFGFFTCGVTAIVGLILGIVAMGQVRKSNGALSGHGMALAGTIVSAVFLLMIPVGAAMLLPAFSKAHDRARTIICVNNMKQLALAARIYAGDHTDHFPPAATWCDAIKSEAGPEQIYKCPAENGNPRCSYAFNARLDGMDDKNINPNTVLFFETEGGWNISGGPELMLHQSRHGRVFVVAFADGSVQQVTAAKLSDLRWDP